MRHDKDRPRSDRFDGTAGVADMTDEEFWARCDQRAQDEAHNRKTKGGRNGKLHIPKRATDT